MIPHDAGRVPSAIATLSRGSHTVVFSVLSVYRSFPSIAQTSGARLLRAASGVKFQIGDSFGSTWLHLLLAGRLKMRPGWSRLAFRSLVRAEPAWPRCGLVWPWLRIRRRGWEWPGVAKLLKRSHLVSFSLIPLVYAGQGCEIPAFAGTTKSLRRNDAYNHCKGWRGDGAMGNCRGATQGLDRVGGCLYCLLHVATATLLAHSWPSIA